MTTIYKYKLEPTTNLELPKGAFVLSAGQQSNEVFLWIKINPKETETEKRTFYGFGTGHEISDDLDIEFIDSVFLDNGLVFHIFEEIKR